MPEENAHEVVPAFILVFRLMVGSHALVVLQARGASGNLVEQIVVNLLETRLRALRVRKRLLVAEFRRRLAYYFVVV